MRPTAFPEQSNQLVHKSEGEMDYTLDQIVVFDSGLNNALKLEKTISLGAAIALIQLHATLREPFEIRDHQTGESVLAFRKTLEGLDYIGEPWLTDKVVPEVNSMLAKMACVMEARPDLIEKMQFVHAPAIKAPF